MKKWRGTTLAALAALLLFGAACSSQEASQQTEEDEQVLPQPSFFASARSEDDEGQMMPAGIYSLFGAAEVNGRQGVCCEAGSYWVSGSASLAKYDADWNLIAENKDPFKGYDREISEVYTYEVSSVQGDAASE